MRIAYLNTKYPALSHTFIEREIRAVRACGIEIETFSIHRPGTHDQLGSAHEEAARSTCYILDGIASLALAVMRTLLHSPCRFIRAVIESQRLSPPGIRARLRHLAYFVEAARLAQEMRRRDLHHVHVHMANNGAAVAMLATYLDVGISYSLSIHGSAEFFHVDSWCLKPKAERAAFVRCISSFCRSQVMAWTSPDAWSRYHIVHCGVDTASFVPRSLPVSGRLRIVTVGRLDPVKGYPIFLEACRALSDDRIEWQLDMIGDGPMRERLQRQAHELCIDDHVRFQGAVGQDDLQRFLDQADVMIVSSFMEGVPVVLMEAMSKQLAVIATAVGGVPELITDGVNGLLVTPGSIESLHRALRRLAVDQRLLAQLGGSARRVITEQFDVGQVGREMAALFSRYCAHISNGSGAGVSALAPAA